MPSAPVKLSATRPYVMSSVRLSPSSASEYAAAAYAILPVVSTAIALIRAPCARDAPASKDGACASGIPPSPSWTVRIPSRVETYSRFPSASTARASSRRGFASEPSSWPAILRMILPSSSSPVMPLIVSMNASSSIADAFLWYQGAGQSSVPLVSCASTYAIPSRVLAAMSKMYVSLLPILWVPTAENPSLAFSIETTDGEPGEATYIRPAVASTAASLAPVLPSAPSSACGSANVPVAEYEQSAGMPHAPLPTSIGTMTWMALEPASDSAEPGPGSSRIALFLTISVMVPPLSRSASVPV